MWNASVTMVLESRVGRKALERPDPSDTTVRFMGVYGLTLFGKEKGEHEYLSTRRSVSRKAGGEPVASGGRETIRVCSGIDIS